MMLGTERDIKQLYTLTGNFNVCSILYATLKWLYMKIKLPAVSFFYPLEENCLRM